MSRPGLESSASKAYFVTFSYLFLAFLVIRLVEIKYAMKNRICKKKFVLCLLCDSPCIDEVIFKRSLYWLAKTTFNVVLSMMHIRGKWLTIDAPFIISVELKYQSHDITSLISSRFCSLRFLNFLFDIFPFHYHCENEQIL